MASSRHPVAANTYASLADSGPVLCHRRPVALLEAAHPGDARWHLTSVEQVDRALHGGAAVAVVAWPDDAEVLEQLRRLGLPRLLILGADAAPATTVDALEDWIRLPASDDDVRVRLRALREHAEHEPMRPVLADDGRLVFEGAWVALSATDERLARCLVDSFLSPVREADIVAAVWPGEHPSPGTIRPRISRVRRRLAAIGLDIATVRGRGYVLQPRADRHNRHELPHVVTGR